ncbi:MBL fold metallo-hydrolase [Candidatus Saccharibacteria bacterium]|nr:MBL fold metallo-hydrolase [Candidatus Saccharibacteria bacterium]
MVKITHIGRACFQIEGKDISYVVDPYDETVAPMPHLTADYLLISHEHGDHNNRAAVTVTKTDTPANVKTIASFHDDEQGAKRGNNIIHVINVDDVKVCHLGDLGHLLSPEQVAAIGKVNVLMIPVGGFYTIDAAQALEVINQLEPQIIIPMHYRPAKVQKDAGNYNIATVDDFITLAKQSGLDIQTPNQNWFDYSPNQTGVLVI